MTKIPNFGFELLEFGIWNFFVICFLVLGIFLFMGITVVRYPFVVLLYAAT